MSLRSRYLDTRRAYMAKPTRAGLRLYLIAKARYLKTWDDRYCRYYGVSPDVSTKCKRFIIRGYARGLVPTSTKRNNRTGSYHDQRNSRGEGVAVDMGLIERHIGTMYGWDKMVAFQRAEHRAFQRGLRRGMVELIGPDNKATVLRGRQTDLTEGTELEQQHDTHVHAAFRG